MMPCAVRSRRHCGRDASGSRQFGRMEGSQRVFVLSPIGFPFTMGTCNGRSTRFRQRGLAL